MILTKLIDKIRIKQSNFIIKNITNKTIIKKDIKFPYTGSILENDGIKPIELQNIELDSDSKQNIKVNRGYLKDESLLNQFINLLMKDGEKAQTQNIIMNMLINIRKRTKTNPYLVIKEAMIVTNPILGIINSKKGNKTFLIPKPLNLRQSRRFGIKNIILESEKRDNFKVHERLASELIGCCLGSSKAVNKKEELHKVVLANRSNTNLFNYNKK